MARTAEIENEMRELKVARSTMQEEFTRMKELKEDAEQRIHELEGIIKGLVAWRRTIENVAPELGCFIGQLRDAEKMIKK